MRNMPVAYHPCNPSTNKKQLKTQTLKSTKQQKQQTQPKK